jgi:acetyl esterase/lipase
VKWLIGAMLVIVAAIGFVWWTAGPGTLDTLDWAQRRGDAAFTHQERVAYGTQSQTLDVWHLNNKCIKRPILVFFYGGGWVKGTAAEYGWAARAYADKGFTVVVPDYRKVPGVAYPAFVQDAAEAVKWARDNADAIGGDADKIAIAGHSAGGYAVAALALDRRWMTAVGVDPAVVKAAVGLSGPYDFFPFTGRAVAAFGAWPTPAETQPIAHARADAPPMMLVTGTEDTTVRPKNARNLAARLLALGAPAVLKEYAALGHEDIVMALSLPFRDKAPVLDDTSAFVMRALAKRPCAAQ